MDPARRGLRAVEGPPPAAPRLSPRGSPAAGRLGPQASVPRVRLRRSPLPATRLPTPFRREGGEGAQHPLPRVGSKVEVVRGVGRCNSPRALADAESGGAGATLGTPSRGPAAPFFQASKPSGFRSAAPHFPVCVSGFVRPKGGPPSPPQVRSQQREEAFRETQRSQRGREPSPAPPGKAAAQEPFRAGTAPGKAQLLRTNSPLELPTYFCLRSCVPTNSGSHPGGRWV